MTNATTTETKPEGTIRLRGRRLRGLLDGGQGRPPLHPDRQARRGVRHHAQPEPAAHDVRHHAARLRDRRRIRGRLADRQGRLAAGGALVSYQHGWTVSAAAAEEMHRDAHPCCLECEQPGCLREDCPSSFCETEALVTHDGELMHARCVAAWDRHIENRCDGTTCHCPAATAAVSAGWLARLAAVAALVLAAVTGQGCAAHVAAPEVEQVGQLAAGPSVYTAPLKHDAPPSLGFVAGSDDDSVGEVATTVVRAGVAVDAGEPDTAPAVEEKVAHGF